MKSFCFHLPKKGAGVDPKNRLRLQLKFKIGSSQKTSVPTGSSSPTLHDGGVLFIFLCLRGRGPSLPRDFTVYTETLPVLRVFHCERYRILTRDHCLSNHFTFTVIFTFIRFFHRHLVGMQASKVPGPRFPSPSHPSSPSSSLAAEEPRGRGG